MAFSQRATYSLPPSLRPFRYAFHTNLLVSGVFSLSHDKLDIPYREFVNALGIRMSMKLTEPREVSSAPRPIPFFSAHSVCVSPPPPSPVPAQDVSVKHRNESKFLNVANLSGVIAGERGAASYAHHHYLFAEAEKLKMLLQLEPGIHETLAVCALKRSSNELIQAKDSLKPTSMTKLNQYLRSGVAEPEADSCA